MSDLKKLTPAAGYLLIDPQKEERTTASGIVLPDSHEGEKPQVGVVVSINPDNYTDDHGVERTPPCKKGQKVVFKKWAGNEFKFQNQETEYLFVKFEDIMAVLA